MKRKDLGGSSRASLAALRSSLDQSISALTGQERERVTRDLFAALSTLDSSVGLRRALTDPSRDSAAKSVLVQEIFGKVISPSALSLLVDLASLRWSKPSDIADALERIAIESLAAGAEAAGQAENLEAEIFAVAGVISSSAELRNNLNLSTYSPEAKSSLLDSIFAPHISDSTKLALSFIATSLRGRKIEHVLNFYGNTIVARKNRSVAHVKSAVALSEEQEAKLSGALEKALGKKVRVAVEVDSSILGGISIRVGDELIDGTVFSRLVNASRSLVGKK
jgi:F-type H+-transporting ATPase subunit delta